MKPKKNQHSSSYSKKLNTHHHWFEIFPIILFTAIVPIIIRAFQFSFPMQGFFWHSGKNQVSDFFSYGKSQIIIFSAIIAILILIYKIMRQTFKLKSTKLYIPMLIYGLFIIASWIFSDYPFFAYHGYIDRFEGSLVLLSYLFMTFYIINTIDEEKHIKWIFATLTIVLSIMGFIGVSQYFIHDFFQSTLGKQLITPSTYWGHLDSLKFNFTESEIYQTSFNPNYVSFYLALIVPISGFFFIREHAIKKKILFGFIYALFVFNLFGSKSSGGIAGISFAALVALILFNKKLLKWWKSVALALGIALVILISMSSTLFPELNATISRFEDSSKINNPNIQSILTDHNKILVDDGENTLTIQLDQSGETATYHFLDSDNNKLPIELSKDLYSIPDSRYDQYTAKFGKKDDLNFLVLYINDSQWNFILTNEGFKYFNNHRKAVDLVKVEKFGFEGKEKFGSSRGYIWSRSLPLLKDTLLIGHGADTYALIFPQNDYVGKGASYSNRNIIVDKPHCWYLQIGINTGVISLIAVIALFFMYIIWSFKLYFKNPIEDFLSISGSAIFIGICGFLFAALVNDSSVSVAPMFWGLFGVGIAINMQLEKDKQSFSK